MLFCFLFRLLKWLDLSLQLRKWQKLKSPSLSYNTTLTIHSLIYCAYSFLPKCLAACSPILLLSFEIKIISVVLASRVTEEYMTLGFKFDSYTLNFACQTPYS